MQSFFFLTGLLGPLTNMYGFESIYNEYVSKVKAFNTIVYVWHFYKDFGAAGVYLFSCTAGMLAAFFYRNTIRKATLFRVSLWGLFAPCILLSFHTPLYQHWFLYMNILFFIIASRKITIT